MRSADCLNTKSSNGRNATPLPIIQSAAKVLDGIDLDPASDSVINSGVGAGQIYTLAEDGLRQPWQARSAWLNPPGKTTSQGRTVSASDWIRKLYRAWQNDDVDCAIALVYRAGSIGSLGDILQLPLCLTAACATSTCVNGSGRISFETIEGDRRVPQTSNTQSSVFILFPDSIERIHRFEREFKRYGVVKSNG